MLAKIGIGAVFTAKVKPLLQGLKQGKAAYQQFGQGAAKATAPVKGIGTAVNAAATRIKSSMATVSQGAKVYVVGAERARDANGKFVTSAKPIPPLLDRIKTGMLGVATVGKKMMAGMGRGFGKIKAGMMGAAMGMAPMTLAVGAGVRAAAGFEKQMSAVGAVSRANASDMGMLTKEAKRMGIVSTFSASQSGEAMENMARAGARPTEIIQGLSGVMNAAAADGIGLAESSDIVARVVKGMGLEWTDASHIADTLALASASSNTNMMGLGEAFVYGSATARQLGISLEQQTSIFSKLADAGLRGSMAGTSYANMMKKLSVPSKKATEQLKKWNIQLTNNDGSLRKVATIAEEVGIELAKIPDVLERNGLAAELFGVRGAKAYSALVGAGADATLELEKQLLASSKGEGAAQEMANKRLDNFMGKLTLLKSSLEGAAIGIFGPLLGQFANPIGVFTDSLNGVLIALEDINEIYNGVNQSQEDWTKAASKHGKIAWSVAMGIADAVNTIGGAWEWVVEKFNQGGDWLEKTFGADGLRKITKFMVLLSTGAAVAAPIILALMTVGWVLSGLASIATGVASVLAAVFWPAVAAGAALYAIWRSLRKENETFLDTTARVWGNIKEWIVDVYENALKPFWEGIKMILIPALENLSGSFDLVATRAKGLFNELFGFIFEGTNMTKDEWKTVGNVIGAIIFAIAKTVITVVGWIISAITGIVIAAKWVGKKIWSIFDLVGTFIGEHFAKIAMGFSDIFGGNFVRGLKRIGLALLDGILVPLQAIVKGALQLADALNIDVPKGVREFAKGGMTKVAGYAGLDETDAQYIPPKSKSKKPSVYKPNDMFETGDYNTAFGIPGLKAEMKAMESEAARDNYVEMKDAVKKGVKEGAAEAPKETNIEIENTMCVDGEALARAQSRHKIELQERAGFKSTPWQRRQAAEHGAVLTTKTG